MNRLLLSFAGAALIGTHLSAGADSLNDTAQAAYDQRAQLDTQRDRLTGADQLGHARSVADDWVDTPVDTQDTPKQESQP
jgi:hypothetical protein